MKRRIRTVSNMFIASAAVMALIIGFSLGAINDLSRSVIDRVFPITYDVEFINGSHDILHDAKVSFNGDTASISSAGLKYVVNINDAVFSCTNESLRSQNTIRHAMLVALISSVAFGLAASLAWFGIEVRSLASHKAKRRTVCNIDRNSDINHCGQYAAPHAA